MAFGAGSTGTLSLNGTSLQLITLSTDAATGTPVVENGGAADAIIDVGKNAAGAFTYAEVIRDGAGGGALGLTKSGSHTLTLAGNLPYTGETKVVDGTLKLAGPENPLGGGALTINADAGWFDLTWTD